MSIRLPDRWRTAQGQYDLLIMNSGWFTEMYFGGVVDAVTDIDPGFQLESDIYTLDNTVYFDVAKKGDGAERQADLGPDRTADSPALLPGRSTTGPISIRRPGSKRQRPSRTSKRTPGASTSHRAATASRSAALVGRPQ
jgi:hypothetical protein